jgi:hypothetical protein
MNSPLIIPLCRHTFPDGRHCHVPAVRGRACCRHHLDARTRLHAMARSRRVASFARLFMPRNRRDVALNRIEVMRVINKGSLDYTTARMLLWSMDLAAATFPAESKTRRDRPSNPNVFYYVPINRLFSQRCIDKVSEVPENTRGQRGDHRIFALETHGESAFDASSPARTRTQCLVPERL